MRMPRWYAKALCAVVGLAGLVAGAALTRSTWGALLAGGLAASLSWMLLSRAHGAGARDQHRPLPPGWREFLLDWVDHYDRLPHELRERFERACQRFLRDKRISGVGIDVSDELRLLVAASAVTVSLGWEDYAWEQLTEVLLYPDDFGRDDYGFEDPQLAGEAHPWGTVILSVPTLEHSFEDPTDGYHVGVHEFAHLLDLEQGGFGGLPAGLSDEAARRWQAAAEREMQRLRSGGRSAFDEYGASDPAEFFAVAVEAFFERPVAVRRRHREVYDALQDFLAQDPARWERARSRIGDV